MARDGIGSAQAGGPLSPDDVKSSVEAYINLDKASQLGGSLDVISTPELIGIPQLTDSLNSKIEENGGG